MIKTILIASILIFTSSVFAKDKNSFLPATKIDTATSTFSWKGTKKVGGNHFGPIKLKTANSKMKNGKIISGEFVMDMTTIDSKDLAHKPEKKNNLVKHLKSADFFDVTNHNTAKLIITELANGKAKGKLTIKGKTHPINISYKQDHNSFTGKMTFDRTKYGITYKSKNFFKKLIDSKVINDEVTVDFKVHLI